MADRKIAYGTSTSITIALASLASSATAGRESLAVDNGTDKFLDALVRVEVTIPNSGTIGGDLAVYVYAYGSEDGTHYPDTVTGADAAITLNSPSQLRLLGVINCPAINALYRMSPRSVAAAFGGIMPRKWGIAVRNYCNVALHTQDNAANFTGIYETVV